MHVKQINIIVPVYNEGSNLHLFHNSLTEVLYNINRYRWKITYIDDGSTDNSWEEIQRIINKYNHVHPRSNKQQSPTFKYGPIAVNGIRLSRNFGKEAALTAGIEHSNADAVICIDADLQHPPEVILEFLEKWEHGYEIVIGVRKEEKDFSVMRKIGSRLFYYLMNRFASVDLYPKATDFRLLDKKVVDLLKTFKERTRLVRGLIDWMGFEKTYITFVSPARRKGQSSFNFRKLFNLAINSLTSFSLLPLKFTGYLGVGIAGFSLLLLCYMVIGKFLLNQVYTPLAFFVVFNTFLIGIVLCALGMIALYIGHIHTEVVERPLYIVKERLGFGEK